MEQELSDLLTEAKSGPPPVRYSADDVVAAGRRLRRRRRQGAWAGAAAAVVLVAVGIAVPRFAEPDVVAMPAAPVTGTITYPAGQFEGNLAAATVNGWTVSGTVSVTPAYQVAVVTRAAERGQVLVFRPTVFDATEARGRWEPVAVRDRPGFYRDSVLIWEYADDAWAMVSIEGYPPDIREQLVAIAAGVRSAEAQPMRVGVEFGYVPTGYRLASAAESPDRDGQTGLLLRKGEPPSRYNADETIESNPDRSVPTIQVSIRPSSEGQAAGDPVCEPGTCYRLTDDGRYALVLNAALPQTEMLRMLREATFADITDRGTWFAARDAVG